MRVRVVLLGLALSACDGRASWNAELRARYTASDALAATVELPPAPVDATLEPPSDRSARVVIADTVDLDRTRLVVEADFPEHGDAVARALALPPPPLRFASIDDDGDVSLPGTVDSDGHDAHRPLGAPLETMAFRRSELSSVVVLADASVPTSAVGRVLALVADLAGTSRAELVLGGSDGPVAVPLGVRRLVASSPDSGSIRDAEANDLEIEVEVEVGAAGVRIRSPGGVVTPGCDGVAHDALTLPSVDGSVDADGLRRCIERVHAELTEQVVVYVAASPDRPLRELVPALVAIESGSGGSWPPVLLPGPLARAPETPLADVLSGGAVTGSVLDVLVPAS